MSRACGAGGREGRVLSPGAHQGDEAQGCDGQDHQRPALRPRVPLGNRGREEDEDPAFPSLCDASWLPPHHVDELCMGARLAPMSCVLGPRHMPWSMTWSPGSREGWRGPDESGRRAHGRCVQGRDEVGPKGEAVMLKQAQAGRARRPRDRRGRDRRGQPGRRPRRPLRLPGEEARGGRPAVLRHHVGIVALGEALA